MSIRLIVSLALLLILAVVTSSAEAAVAPSRGRTQLKSVRGRSLNKVSRYLRRRQVARHLREKGMNAAEITNKLDRLGDDELFDFSEKLDEIDSGQGDCEEAIAQVLLTYFLIMIFFPFYLLFLMFCEGVTVTC
jgi:hypothetical protein